MLLQEKIGAVMVVGGGIAGIQAALDLANSGYYVYLVERSGAIGGAMAKLAKTFPTNDSSMCILSPKLVECGRHLNIELKTLTEVVKVEGEVTNFTVTLRQHPRYVDTDRCIACSKCSRRCPREVKDEFNERLGFRKAIYILYPQAVPLKYQVDPNHCDRLLGGNCRICEEACPAQALLFNDQVREYSVRVGSIILAPGYRTFDPRWDCHLGLRDLPQRDYLHRTRAPTFPPRGPRGDDFLDLRTTGNPKNSPSFSAWAAGITPPLPRLLLVRVLHVRHQGGHDRHGTGEGS